MPASATAAATADGVHSAPAIASRPRQRAEVPREVRLAVKLEHCTNRMLDRIPETCEVRFVSAGQAERIGRIPSQLATTACWSWLRPPVSDDERHLILIGDQYTTTLRQELAADPQSAIDLAVALYRHETGHARWTARNAEAQRATLAAHRITPFQANLAEDMRIEERLRAENGTRFEWSRLWPDPRVVAKDPESLLYTVIHFEGLNSAATTHLQDHGVDPVCLAVLTEHVPHIRDAATSADAIVALRRYFDAHATAMGKPPQQPGPPQAAPEPPPSSSQPSTGQQEPSPVPSPPPPAANEPTPSGGADGDGDGGQPGQASAGQPGSGQQGEPPPASASTPPSSGAGEAQPSPSAPGESGTGQPGLGSPSPASNETPSDSPPPPAAGQMPDAGSQSHNPPSPDGSDEESSGPASGVEPGDQDTAGPEPAAGEELQPSTLPTDAPGRDAAQPGNPGSEDPSSTVPQAGETGPASSASTDSRSSVGAESLSTKPGLEPTQVEDPHQQSEDQPDPSSPTTPPPGMPGVSEESTATIPGVERPSPSASPVQEGEGVPTDGNQVVSASTAGSASSQAQHGELRNDLSLGEQVSCNQALVQQLLSISDSVEMDVSMQVQPPVDPFSEVRCVSGKPFVTNRRAQSDIDLGVVGRCVQRLERAMVGPERQAMSRRPGPRINLDRVIANSNRFYQRREEGLGMGTPNVVLIVDCSGSMRGIHADGGRHLVAVLGDLAKRGRIRGHIACTQIAGTTHMCQVFPLPMQLEDIRRIPADGDGEGIKPTLDRIDPLVQEADVVALYSDCCIGDDKPNLSEYHRRGVFIHGLYVGPLERAQTMRAYTDHPIAAPDITTLIDRFAMQLLQHRRQQG